jgi:hypothetical protein
LLLELQVLPYTRNERKQKGKDKKKVDVGRMEEAAGPFH